MAVDVCSSEIPSLVSSPRISFSHYLSKTKTVPIEPPLFDFDFDFNFCIRNDFTNLSSADEIFFNGKILPVGIKTQLAPPKGIDQCDAATVGERNADEGTKKKKLKEFLCSEFDAEDLKPQPRSFWKYRRSSTVNSESLGSKTLLRSLQFLSRSNSTGSSLNPKQTAVSKDNQKRNPSKQSPVALNSRSLPHSSGHCPPCNAPRRTSSMKNFRSNSNCVGVGFSPVLNIPYSCIDRGSVMSLFGFGSLFSNGKAKKKKK